MFSQYYICPTVYVLWIEHAGFHPDPTSMILKHHLVLVMKKFIYYVIHVYVSSVLSSVVVGCFSVFTEMWYFSSIIVFLIAYFNC